MYGYSKEQLKKKNEEFTEIAGEFISGKRPAKELSEFVDKLAPIDAFIFGQCYGNLLRSYCEVKTGIYYT